MKKYLVIICILFSTLSVFSQSIPKEIEGTWMGKLNAGITLRIVFHFKILNDTLYTSIDSPDQGVNAIPTAKTTYTNGKILVEIPIINGSYSGIYNAEDLSIIGTWTQNASLPLTLTKVDTVEAIKHPQIPVKPYPYSEEEVTIKNNTADSVTLAGTLTIPKGKGPFKAIVLVTGSGPQDRDETILGQKPFLVLSDYLTRNNIIVLRYDDRGFAKSTGKFINATSQDFASDANAAVNYLLSRQKELHISEIGIAGHSEGGLVAPLAASQNKAVDFIVLLAGPGIPGDSILNLQGNLIAKASGFTDEMITYYMHLRAEMIQVVKTESDYKLMAYKIIDINKKFIASTPQNVLTMIGMTPSDTLNGIDFFANAWMKYFLTYDPAPILEKTKIPVLALNGTHDLQVPYKENLSAIDAALKKAKNKHYSIVEMGGLNHLFQHSDTGLPSEYTTIEETMSPDALKIISDWITSLK